ncbi:MAG TPA: hypothetical protein VEZ14_09795 [Dehalococcoidia bacterium]|nr:hypothetical protein [Dehalococcoidia bacterium]
MTAHDDMIERCLTRLLDGESVDDILASYPGEAAALWPLLEAASALAHAPAPPPPSAARQLALSRMLTQVAEQSAAPAPAGVIGWLGTLRARPLAFQAMAVAGAVVLFAGLGIGASAATGTTPEPVRTLFRLPDDSGTTTHVSGTLVSATDSEIVIETPSGRTTLVLAASTVLRRDGARIGWGDLRPGEHVGVSGNRRDGRVTATEVDADGAAIQGAGGNTPSAGATEGANPNNVAGDQTETPQEQRTPGADDHGGREDATGTVTPPSTGTPSADHGSGDERGSMTPQATRTADGERDGTPSVTRTPEPTHSSGDMPEATGTARPPDGGH